MSDILYLLDSDAASLRHRINQLSSDPHSRRALQRLRTELDRAIVLPEAELPANVVRIGSRVEVHDLTDDDTSSYVLCFPEHAEITAGRLSVFAPLGTALLGFPEGYEFTWDMPGGPRRLKIVKVEPPAPAAPSTGIPTPSGVATASPRAQATA